jgi:hypothetical protein
VLKDLESHPELQQPEDFELGDWIVDPNSDGRSS